ncbi:phospholipase A2 inhibitor NAI-like isoform X1 [Pseudophryne corroboree]|uniref:phospholipase A2 inhibitor NAI-like isoform X1 n=1 Tax=Pseudophryne corroboree TaxID=495146 RepID=UPI0030814B9E
MGPVLRFLCILSALAATGFSLSCNQCVATGSSSCTGTTVTCPADYTCGSTRTVSTASGVTSSAIVMSCIPQNQCDTSGSISTADIKTKIGITCCNTDNCTPSPSALPGDSSQPNGLTCRSCISATSDWCYTGDTVQCTGSEDMCLLQRSNIYAPSKLSTAIRGCATKNMCSLSSQSSAGDVKVTCSSGSFGLRSSIIFTSILALAVSKIVYF